MSNIDTINVGGIDYSVEDTNARYNAITALDITAYKEDGNTASRAYAVLGTPINWKGALYYTIATIAEGATLEENVNVVDGVNIGVMLTRIKAYVGEDGKLHFVDATGADSVLPFKGGSVHYNLGSITGEAASGTNLTTKLTGLGIDPDSLTSSNFIIQCTSFGAYVHQETGAAVYSMGSRPTNVSYNQSTHVITYTRSASSGTIYYTTSGDIGGYLHVFVDSE